MADVCDGWVPGNAYKSGMQAEPYENWSDCYARWEVSAARLADGDLPWYALDSARARTQPNGHTQGKQPTEQDQARTRKRGYRVAR